MTIKKEKKEVIQRMENALRNALNMAPIRHTESSGKKKKKPKKKAS